MTESLPDRIEGSLSTFLDLNPMVGEKRSPERRFWTGREIKTLRDTYPSGGLKGCLPLLPGRTAKAVYQTARQQGLLSPSTKRGGARQRWQSSEQIDRLIRDAYGRVRKAKDITRLAQTLGRPRWWISKRAVVLGCAFPRFKPEPWTEKETQIIAENAYRKLSTLRRLLGNRRSETAISVKLKRIEAEREDPNHFTATGLAKVLGCDIKAVTAAIAKDWLKATRRGTDRVAAQGGDQWWIHRRDVARFVVENVHAVNFAKVDKYWLVDLLITEGRAGAHTGADA